MSTAAAVAASTTTATNVSSESTPASSRSESTGANAMSIDSDAEDEILAEIPVYLNSNLSEYLYLFQYPLRNAPFNNKNGPVAARIKPGSKMVELDLPLDIRSPCYNTDRGEDFAMGMNDKTIKTAFDRRMEEHEEESSHSYNKTKKKEEELLDKMTLTSTYIPDQTKYLVGVLRQDELHVTPIHSVVQMRPGFKYIDKIDDKLKAANKRIQDQEKLEEKKPVVEKNEIQAVQVGWAASMSRDHRLSSLSSCLGIG
ncbi:Sin-like protein conserved region-domain-containing protein [Spinellus fusiger]|nr:Sin-like protein conserved region-domain-containing protein [Spinellus fusiger]